jgi:hypothetical protein
MYDTYIALELWVLPREILPQPSLFPGRLVAHKVVEMLLEERREVLTVEVVIQFR